MQAEALILAPLAALLLAVAVIDARRGLIPDAVNVAIALLGLAATAAFEREALVGRLLDAGLVVLALGVLRAAYSRFRGFSGLGLGDVKFIGAGTFWVGLSAISVVLLTACLAALAVLGLRHAAKGTVTATTRLRFGPYLAAALFAVILADRLLPVSMPA